MIRLSVFAVILIGMLYFGFQKLLTPESSQISRPVVLKTTEGAIPGGENREYAGQTEEDFNELMESKPWLPESSTGAIVDHAYYTLSYNEDYEQAEWVAYPLTQASLRKPNVPRTNYFFDDPKVKTGSATYYDYKGSGYTKGHLAPAADMAFDTIAMRESFYMSNMSPQLRGFNNGIWRELEEQTRDWTYHNGEVYIVTGPVLAGDLPKTKKGVGIPAYFYKIILDNEGPEKKSISFLIPHAISTEPLQSYAVSIDSLEKVTGINFFGNLLSPENEKALESGFELNKWKFSEDRYRLRVNRWNKE